MDKKSNVNKIKILTILIILVIVVCVCLENRESLKQSIEKILPQAIQESYESTSIDETKKTNESGLVDSETMNVEIDASGDEVPVPKGYTGSSVNGENEIDTGYVIYEGEEEVTEENAETARKTRNQYVWVPVPDASKIYGTDSNRKKMGKVIWF